MHIQAKEVQIVDRQNSFLVPPPVGRDNNLSTLGCCIINNDNPIAPYRTRPNSPMPPPDSVRQWMRADELMREEDE